LGVADLVSFALSHHPQCIFKLWCQWRGNCFWTGEGGGKTESAKIGNAKQRPALVLKRLLVSKTSVLQKKNRGAKISPGGPKYLQGGSYPPYFSRLCVVS